LWTKLSIIIMQTVWKDRNIVKITGRTPVKDAAIDTMCRVRDR
jgi:hypothetical protein